MKRPICLIAIGLIFGIIGGQYLEYSPSFFLYIFFSIFFLYIWITKKEKKFLKRIKKVILKRKCFLWIFLISILVGYFYLEFTEKYKYTFDLDEQEIYFSGTILERGKKDNNETYIVKIDTLNMKKLKVKIKVNLVVKENNQNIFSYGSHIFRKRYLERFFCSSK